MQSIKALWARPKLRRIIYLIAIALLWQGAYLTLDPSKRILFPSVAQILEALVREIGDGSLLVKTGYSLYMILIGLLLSFGLTLALTVLSILSKTCKDIMKMLISVLDPLPGIALMPLSILWFGIGEDAIIFVMIHSILWPMLLNVLVGFESVPQIYRDVGRSFGLGRLKLIGLVYVPASFPSILTGIKTGWARAWRALISAEMVFGATGAMGGLGWDIYMKRSFLDMPGMFASLIMIMLIGIVIEDVIFSRVEKATLCKWGVVG